MRDIAESTFAKPVSFKAQTPLGTLNVWKWAGGKRTALLLHGLGHNGRAFDEMATMLCREGFTCLAPDLLGHGQSSWLQDGEYSDSSWGDAIAGLLVGDQESPSLLVGHSIGAIIALRLQTRCRVPLVVIDPPLERRLPATIRPKQPVGQFANLDVLVSAMRAYHPLGNAAILRRIAVHGTTASSSDEIVDVSVDPRVYDRVALFDPWGAVRTLAQVDAPWMLLRGRRSAILSRSRAEELVALSASGQLCELPAAGHGAHLDQAQAGADAVHAFLCQNRMRPQGEQNNG